MIGSSPCFFTEQKFFSIKDFCFIGFFADWADGKDKGCLRLVLCNC